MSSFTSSDTWVMLALLIGEPADGVSLRNIIAAAVRAYVSTA